MRLQPDRHAMARLVHLMEVMVLALPWAGRRLLGQCAKQGLIEKARLSHASYNPLTA